MKCRSGKRAYQTEQEAEEALLGVRINFYHDASGPVNYYLCEDCGSYHLTSTGTTHPMLDDEDVLARIKLERESQEWERKLR